MVSLIHGIRNQSSDSNNLRKVPFYTLKNVRKVPVIILNNLRKVPFQSKKILRNITSSMYEEEDL